MKKLLTVSVLIETLWNVKEDITKTVLGEFLY